MRDMLERLKRHTVFVCHAHHDNKLCDRYVGALIPYGMNIWYDRVELRGGQIFSQDIEQALLGSTAFLVLLSPAAIRSYWVEREIAAYCALAAQDTSRLIIPVRMSECEIPAPLLPFPLIDIEEMKREAAVVMDPETAEKDTFRRAIEEIAHLLGRSLQAPLVSRRAVVSASFATVGGLALAGGAAAWLWNTHRIVQGQRLFLYRGHAISVRWSPNGTRIASGSSDTTIRLFDAANGKLVFIYKSHTLPVVSVAWAPDSARIASASFDLSVEVWNAAAGGQALSYRGHTDAVFAVAWSPGGKYLVSGSKDETVQIWNGNTGSTLLVYRNHHAAVSTVAWSPDGRRIASAGGDGAVHIWDATSGKLLLLYRGHIDPLFSVAWSPDGKHIASTGIDRTVQVWDSSTGQPITVYRLHSEKVHAAVWSPDGLRIASASEDKTVQIWKALTGEHLFTYKGHASYVMSADWSPDGTRIASAGADEGIQVWQAQ
jgi:WD40 repeat protein